MSLKEIINEITTTEQDQHLDFSLSDEEFAIPVINIREIIRYCKLTRMPMVPVFIEGVINLRGKVVPVINLAEKFGLAHQKVDKRTCIIIMDIEIDANSVVIGIVVDKVLQVMEISEDNIESSPSLGAKIQTDFIKGMARIEDGFIIILDISQIFSAEEVTIISDMHKEDKKD